MENNKLKFQNPILTFADFEFNIVILIFIFQF